MSNANLQRQLLSRIQTTSTLLLSRPAGGLRIINAPKPSKEPYEAKNERLKRALSPHLTVYKPHFNTFLSVTHRGTGMVMSFFAWALGCVLLILPQNIEHYIYAVENFEIPGWFQWACRAALAFPLCYHGSNGVRHLLWDTGRYLRRSTVIMTGRMMLLCAFALTLAVSLL